MTNKLKALSLTPCIIAFCALLVYGANELLKSSYGMVSVMVILCSAVSALIYNIVLSLLGS